jgi:small subunit ribosomal protein S1
MLNLGDEIEVVVLEVNKDRQEISLGIKQLETNPWSVASQKYPPGTIVTSKVTSLTNYGAFVEISPGIDGLIHISDLSWTKKFNHPSEILEKGQEVKYVVLSVDEEKHRVSLGVKQLTEDPWIRAIPEKYIPGQIVKGRVTKLTNFGVFIELEPDLEGLLHISEIADHKIESPQEVVKLGEELEVKILRVDSDSRKIGLSLRRVQWTATDKKQKDQDQTEQAAEAGTEKAQEKRGGLDGLLMPGVDTVSVQTAPEQASEEKAPKDKAPEPAVNSEQAPEQAEEPAAEDKEPEVKTEEPEAKEQEPQADEQKEQS